MAQDLVARSFSRCWTLAITPSIKKKSDNVLNFGSADVLAECHRSLRLWIFAEFHNFATLCDVITSAFHFLGLKGRKVKVGMQYETELAFSYDNLLSFGKLSRDWNPIHYYPDDGRVQHLSRIYRIQSVEEIEGQCSSTPFPITLRLKRVGIPRYIPFWKQNFFPENFLTCLGFYRGHNLRGAVQ